MPGLQEGGVYQMWCGKPGHRKGGDHMALQDLLGNQEIMDLLNGIFFLNAMSETMQFLMLWFLSNILSFDTFKKN